MLRERRFWQDRWVTHKTHIQKKMEDWVYEHRHWKYPVAWLQQCLFVNITKPHILLYEMKFIVCYGRNYNGFYTHLLRRSTFYQKYKYIWLNECLEDEMVEEQCGFRKDAAVPMLYLRCNS